MIKNFFGHFLKIKSSIFLLNEQLINKTWLYFIVIYTWTLLVCCTVSSVCGGSLTLPATKQGAGTVTSARARHHACIARDGAFTPGSPH